MVVANGPLAAAAGLEVLGQGGNAADAAVATGFAMAVVFPAAGNLGGGGFVTIRMANGKMATLDYREIAPRAATRDMFVDPATGKVSDRSLVGHLASGVPGSVAGLLATLEKFGTMERKAVIAPAIRLAYGFPVDSSLARSLRRDSSLLCKFAGCAVFFPNGRALRAGDTLRQLALAKTLERIAAEGVNGFYRGPVAQAIAAEMKRGGGIITEQDLAAYKVAWRKPVVGTYRDHTIISMAPSSSGGTTMVEWFNILESFGTAAPRTSTLGLHRMLGAMQLAFIDRNAYLADPDIVKVPVAKLIDKKYAVAQRARLSESRYVSTTMLSPGLEARREGTHTTHYSVVDRMGNAVSTTTTINGSYGSGVWVPDGGFLLNNEMDDFAAQPGTPNMYGLVQGEANAVGPGKRMLSAMTPTIVLDRHERVLLVIGSAGGPRIITGVGQIILNVIDHGMSLHDAMSAPRMHFQGLPETVAMDSGGFAQPVLDSLRAMGWTFGRGSASSSNVAIRRVRGGWEGAFDPRTTGGVAGR
jgi:gamma-glutamyltranspeptidase/glutathione hydrolase